MTTVCVLFISTTLFSGVRKIYLESAGSIHPALWHGGVRICDIPALSWTDNYFGDMTSFFSQNKVPHRLLGRDIIWLVPICAHFLEFGGFANVAVGSEFGRCISIPPWMYILLISGKLRSCSLNKSSRLGGMDLRVCA
jgi:hypothetical protein